MSGEGANRWLEGVCGGAPMRPGVTREWAWACGVSGEAKGGGGSEAGACLDDAGGSALSELLSHGLQLFAFHFELRGVMSHLAAVFFTDLHRALPLDLRPFSLQLNANRRLLVGHFLLGLCCGEPKFLEADGTRGLQFVPPRAHL